MNSHEARRLLEVFRPNGADEADPRFAEALKQVRRDPELARWFREQRRFDASVAAAIRSVPAPGDLREFILASRKVVRPPFWRDWRVRAAAAAIVFVLAVTGGALATTKPVPFAQLRSALVDRAWSADSHLDFESADVARVKQWLARNYAPTEFTLPPGLREARLHGCRIVEVEGHRIPMICLADGPKHLHLFVVNGVPLAQAPSEGAPDFEKCGAWKTASWLHGTTTYVLSGMSYQTFVNRFRKDGRWTTSS
jgi:hypothetical protein